MNKEPLVDRIRKCANEVHAIIKELEVEPPSIERAVVLGCLLACSSALNMLVMLGEEGELEPVQLQLIEIRFEEAKK